MCTLRHLRIKLFAFLQKSINSKNVFSLLVGNPSKKKGWFQQRLHHHSITHRTQTIFSKVYSYFRYGMNRRKVGLWLYHQISFMNSMIKQDKNLILICIVWVGRSRGLWIYHLGKSCWLELHHYIRSFLLSWTPSF